MNKYSSSKQKNIIYLLALFIYEVNKTSTLLTSVDLCIRITIKNDLTIKDFYSPPEFLQDNEFII